MASPQLRFCMAVDAGQLEGGRRHVRTFLRDQGVDEEAAYDVLLCVHEACANAIEHSDSASDVDVAVCVDKTSVSIIVSDDGRGLEVAHHTDQHRPALLSPGGRGLYVMAFLMDEFEVHCNGGTEIRMVKRLT
jgi:anti-sigma regulatory factor (Ser/Thr protein kinase)